ncbi:cytochrome P450 [Aspergillus candidus]|uniref:Putative cytochrome P450 oxidoreductase n=1 Tax=Aspergillus candidus TaxID=41067 RepID=A0A2I2EZC0_ASPCN|nr:putative cytochrome P450 oxidoreductase [Aspergillus candidus]PLB33726.1 putative cytochrome P450 oxidoreductase [Aspergillus candidus]
MAWIDSAVETRMNPASLALVFAGLYLLRLVYNRLRPGLRDIPGPTLAKYTRLWKAYSVWKGNHHLTEIDLHKKHGLMVRIGPKHVSFSDPAAIPTIYGLSTGFTKTAFYPIQSISWNKKPQMNLFSERNTQAHREQKRLVANAYSLSHMLEMEHAIDSCTEIFMRKLRASADAHEPIDLSSWLQFYAFDVVGEMTFATKLGFLERGTDVDDMMSTISNILVYASVCGQVPDAHHFLLGNPIFPLLIPSMESWNSIVQFTLKCINARVALERDGEVEGQDKAKPGKDMLSRWLDVHNANPTKLSTRDIMVHTSTNVFAGSDTTAIALRTIFASLARNPPVLARVMQEIDTADAAGALSDPISYRESATHLPYIAAVFKEAMRIHPSTGLMMEREVPKGGATIAGRYFPAGTVVGVNPWSMHRNTSVFPDPEAFIPERWLDGSPAELKAREQAFFSFGGGSRLCIGKSLALMEMHKLVPQILRRYEVRLHRPDNPWKIRNVWFVQQSDMMADIVPREK